ncbi:MAG TPA: M14 family metallopeptidase [Candidatus Competibacteraceae bacterium]|nr:M14 family metallopeptidase [Candidatus Competibacteraceae bacterium]
MNPPALPFTLEAPLGSAFRLQYHDLGPRERPPRLALVAGLSGLELNGVFVLARLADFLTSLERRGDGPRLRERVLILPAVNLSGLNARSRTWSYEDSDLNRAFPGSEEGDSSQRIAAAVLELTRPAYYRVDVHSSNLDIEELPQVRLYAPNDDERASACLFGLPAILERPLNPHFGASLAHAWRQYGGENFVIQSGLAGQLQPGHCETVFRALLAFLERTDMVEGLSLADMEEDLHYFGLDQTLPLLAGQPGLFVPRIELGRWVQAGERLGSVYDGFGGQVRAEVLAPVGGLVASLRRQPLAYAGDLLVRLLSPRPLDDRLDWLLHDQAQ